jgi:C-terminal processing protease CtpA/Prc
MNGVGDKYGTYFDADEYNRMMLENEGKATGIGVNVIENTRTNTSGSSRCSPVRPRIRAECSSATK